MTTTVMAGTVELTLLEGSEAKDVLRLAEAAHLPGHFEAIVEKLERAVGQELQWKPFGGEGRVAHSALGSAAESTHLLSEPVVNFMDAALEMAYLLACANGDSYRPASMAEAAQRWFGIPSGGLPAWDVRRGQSMADFQELARKSQLLIRPGSTPKMPTVVFLDHWLGQHPADHEGTILSIHKGLKADIPFLAGQYGHGAGFTLAFSHGGQVLVGRRHPRLLPPDYDDLVGLSLVVRRMPSETGHANPTYWYAASPETGTPFAFSPDALGDPRWHGLRRTCIDYEMQRSSERDIYFALDHNITNPALPYALRDERTDEGDKRQFRFMSGNAARLQRIHDGRGAQAGANPIRVPHRRTSRIDLDAWMGDGGNYGSVEVITTFVKQESTGKGNELYAPVKEAEVWTLNGQRHHARSRLHFGQEPIRLDAIRDNLMVEVRLDDLSPDSKALILTTDRQGAAEREVRFELEAAIDDLLKSDSDLRALNDAAREAALQDAAKTRMKDLDRELAQFEHFVRTEKVKVRVKRKRRRSGGGTPPAIELDPIAPLHDHPTFVRFRKVYRETLRIAPGKTTSVLMEADAVDGYFNASRQPTFQFHPSTGSALTVYSTDELLDGRMRVRVKAAADASLGPATLVATYLPPNAPAPLTTEIDVVITPPKAGGSGTGGARETEVWDVEEQDRPAPPAYEVLFEERSPTWAERGMTDWTGEVVGAYKNDVAYVNGDFGAIKRLLQAVRPAQQQEYLTLYLAPIIMTLIGLAKKEADPPRDEDSGAVVELHDTYRAAALESVALSSIFTIRKLRKLSLLGTEEDE